MAIGEFAFQLFDVEGVVETEDPALLAPFAGAYGRFRLTKPGPGAVRYRICPNGELVFDGQVHRVPALDPSTGSELALNGVKGQALLADYAYTRVIADVLGRVRSHFLIHAAALSQDGRGLLIAGPSGYGKTTLALALLQQGFTLLSDDVAALGRADGLLYPFPRALHVRGGDGPVALEYLGQAACEPCPAGVLVELDDGRPPPTEQRLWATVDRAPHDLLEALRTLAKVRAVETHPAGRFVEIVLWTGEGTRGEATLETACREQGVMLFDVRRRPARAPDFDRPPHLTPLAPHETALALLRHLRGGAGSALVQELGGPVRTFLALAGIAAGLRGYRLQVGVRDGMVALVREAMENERDRTRIGEKNPCAKLVCGQRRFFALRGLRMTCG